MLVILLLHIEPFTTNRASHSPNTSVNRHVVVTILRFAECFGADVTVVPNTSVFIHVHFKICYVIISFVTLVTEIGVFPRMTLHVLP